MLQCTINELFPLPFISFQEKSEELERKVRRPIRGREMPDETSFNRVLKSMSAEK